MVDHNTMKERLLAEQANLQKQLSELGVHDATSPTDWIATPEDVSTTEADENVVADRAEEWIERRGELAALETRFNNIARALTKLEAGTFGMCEICDAEIESDRLAVNPAARTCKTHLEDEAQLPL